MKNKILTILVLFYLMCFGLAIRSNAQDADEGGENVSRLKNGISIAFRSESTTGEPTSKQFNHIYTHELTKTKNTVSRIIVDIKRKVYFGYDLTVTPQAEKRKYKVAIKPLSYDTSGWDYLSQMPAQSLPAYPEEFTVEDGDVITLDILENPLTKAKIYDLIKITDEYRVDGHYFLERKVPLDFTIDKVEMQLRSFELFVNGEKREGGFALNISGKNLYFQLADKGFFVLSPIPREGYNFQKIGVIQDKVIKFTFNSDEYKLVSKIPVLCSGGNWNLWIFHQPARNNSKFYYGSIDDLKRIIK